MKEQKKMKQKLEILTSLGGKGKKGKVCHRKWEQDNNIDTDGRNNQPSADQQTKCLHCNDCHKGEFWYINGKGTIGNQHQRSYLSKKEVEIWRDPAK